MKDIESRRKEFRRNRDLEYLLEEVNCDLRSAESDLLQREIKEFPVIFIMGAMRSGTTLLEQWMASCGEFAYPTNIVSRFYEAPIIGCKIQKLLTDPKYNFRNEIMEFNSKISFDSNNGKTKGAIEPNEFWYFWRRFFPDDLRKYTSDELIKEVDTQTLSRELWGMAQVFGKPLALKGMICNYHIPFLDKIFPKAIFISLQRNMDNHVQSVLEARKRQFGTYKEWYSFLIPEYEELIQITDIEIQVKKQIECINRAVEKGLESVSDYKKIRLEYESFCRNPKKVYQEIRDKLIVQGCHIREKYMANTYFVAR